MKRRNLKNNVTRKRKQNNVKVGGQASIPPYAHTDPATISNFLTQFEQQAAILANWAQQYQTVTNSLNNQTLMAQHLQYANDLSVQANQVFNAANNLYKEVYGIDWPIPPAPAPSS